MSSWAEIEREVPDLAQRVRTAFDANKHKVLATLRKDGSPRVSGTEVDFLFDEAWIGSMPGAMKALDLLRDPRLAVHGAPVDVELRDGDAKVSGRAVEVDDEQTIAEFMAARWGEGAEVPDEPFHLFRLDIDEVVLTTVAGDPPDHMVIESWRQGRGLRSDRR